MFLDDWQDNSRDIINFLTHYLPESSHLEDLPTHLVRVSPEESAARLKAGFTRRQIVTIGHSFGGATSYARPSLIFREPTMGLITWQNVSSGILSCPV